MFAVSGLLLQTLVATLGLLARAAGSWAAPYRGWVCLFERRRFAAWCGDPGREARLSVRQPCCHTCQTA